MKPLIIYGPTSTGKTSLSLKIAKKFNCALISADSRQIYKNLDIGTGKVSFENNVIKKENYWLVDGVRVYGFDIVNPGDNFSTADYIEYAKRAMEEINKEGKSALIVGGTGFYIKSLISGLGAGGIPRDPDLRQKLEKLPRETLFKKLLRTDPQRAKNMNNSDKNNPRRLIRAIEIALNTNRSVPIPPITQLPNYLIIGLTAQNDFLYKKSGKWLEERLSHGLLEEVKGLIESGVDTGWLESLGLEYRWFTKYLTQNIGLDDAITRLKGDTHSLIRRQKTWFRQFKGIHLYDIQETKFQSRLESQILSWYTENIKDESSTL